MFSKQIFFGALMTKKKLFKTNIMGSKHFWAPKNRGPLGYSLRCLCVNAHGLKLAQA